MSDDSLPLGLPLWRLADDSCEATTLYRELRKPLLRYLVCSDSRATRRRTWCRMLLSACSGIWLRADRKRIFAAGCFAWRTIRRGTGRTAITGVSGDTRWRR